MTSIKACNKTRIPPSAGTGVMPVFSKAGSALHVPGTPRRDTRVAFATEPFQGTKSFASTLSQGSSCLATQGFGTQSRRWDCKMISDYTERGCDRFIASQCWANSPDQLPAFRSEFVQPDSLQ